MPLALRSLAPVLHNWTETVGRSSRGGVFRGARGVSQVGFRRFVHPGRVLTTMTMSAGNGTTGRANSAINAANGEGAVSVEPEEDIVEASEAFRARALVSSRAQVRFHGGCHFLGMHLVSWEGGELLPWVPIELGW